MAVVFENPLSGHLHWLFEFVQASDETRRAAIAKAFYFKFALVSFETPGWDP